MPLANDVIVLAGISSYVAAAGCMVAAWFVRRRFRRQMRKINGLRRVEARAELDQAIEEATAIAHRHLQLLVGSMALLGLSVAVALGIAVAGAR